VPVKNRHIIVERYGGPEVLKLTESEMPLLKAGYVRVRILAAGVSYADLLMREGVHPETPPVPFTPGWDFVGSVYAVGEGVPYFALRQMVAGIPIHGGYAQYIDMPANELIPIPAHLNPLQVACLIFNYTTAYQMLYRVAHAQPRQRALIHSAGGGIGTALLQLGRLYGLEMYGTASLSKHSLLRSLNCIPIDYKQQDFVAAVRHFAPEGVDMVFDGIGGPHTWRSWQVLRPGGQVITYGLTSSLEKGQRGQSRRGRLIGLPQIFIYIARSYVSRGRKRVRLYSIQNLRRLRPDWFKTDIQQLFELLKDRRIEPVIAECISLEGVEDAHRKIGTGGVSGKIVINMT
jgi:NADPH:quinone reductase-like Zn-dependent oxidoreductase